MSEAYEVEVKVIAQKGTCHAGHKVGDKWVIKQHTPEICVTAYQYMHAPVETLMYGGSYPWSDDPETARVVCPDPANPVVFELRRLRK